MAREGLRDSRLTNLLTKLLGEPFNTGFLSRVWMLVIGPGTQSSLSFDKDLLFSWHFEA